MATTVTGIEKKLYSLKYSTLKGEDIDLRFHTNDVLAITLESGAVSNVVAKNISTVSERRPDGVSTTFLCFSHIIKEGSTDVITAVDRRVNVEDIVDAVKVKADYIRRDKSAPRPKCDENITFSLDGPKFKTPYRVTVGIGEFLAFSVITPNRGSGKATYYGYIVGYDNKRDMVKFARLVNVDAGLAIRNTDVHVDAINGIFRYDMGITPIEYNDVPDEVVDSSMFGEEVDAADEAVDTPITEVPKAEPVDENEDVPTEADTADTETPAVDDSINEPTEAETAVTEDTEVPEATDAAQIDEVTATENACDCDGDCGCVDGSTCGDSCCCGTDDAEVATDLPTPMEGSVEGVNDSEICPADESLTEDAVASSADDSVGEPDPSEPETTEDAAIRGY